MTREEAETKRAVELAQKWTERVQAAIELALIDPNALGQWAFVLRTHDDESQNLLISSTGCARELVELLAHTITQVEAGNFERNPRRGK